MTFIKWVIYLLLIFVICRFAFAEKLPAVTMAIPIKEIPDYTHYDDVVKNLINDAYILSTKKLTYLYGSSDPVNGGMDCSGTIYFLLQKSHIKDPPRSAEDLYEWVKQSGRFYTSSNLDKLQPGDLLFWSGTYQTSHAITHVMIYLGKNNQGHPLMFGSSDGRTYEGKKMWGVSVFDFNAADKKSYAKFEGFSCIPGLTCASQSKSSPSSNAFLEER